MSNDVLVEKFLSEELGLSKREITLYFNLLKYSPTTILELSEISGMNRVTTHINVESLTKKGLATQIKKGRGSRRAIMAEPIEKLTIIFKDRKAKLEAAENQLPSIMQGLSTLKKERNVGDTMEIRRYSGKAEVKLIYDDVLSSSEIRAYVNCKEIDKVFPGNIQRFLDAHKKSDNMQIWEITEDSEMTREYASKAPPERYHMRLTAKQLNLASIDYILFDGKVAIVDATDEITGIVIENRNFYENAKAIHEFVWQFLPPPH